MSDTPKDEPVYLAASHVGKVGKLVTVDVEHEQGRTLTGGVLTGTHDEYDAGGSVAESLFMVGGRVVRIAWDTPGVSATIRVEGVEA